MNANDIDKFEKLWGQLSGIYEEISLLSRKNPNDALNKFKLGFINTLVAKSNDFLGGKYKPFDDFEAFDEDEVPQNSDVVFILAQYLQCFEKLRADNVVRDGPMWYWKIAPEEGITPDRKDSKGNFLFRTVPPKKLKDK